jgi:type I restriction enzyme M protein
MPKKQSSKNHNGNGVSTGIEHELWEAADKLRGHLDAADYKSVVLGLIFLKYISDLFEQVHSRVMQEGLDDPEDRDVYLAERIFWVPKDARWKNLQDNANQESIGNLIDKAMEAIEQDNPSLKGMLPKNYGRPTLDKRRLGELVTLFSNKVNFVDEESRKQDILGRVYEYSSLNSPARKGARVENSTHPVPWCACW